MIAKVVNLFSFTSRPKQTIQDLERKILAFSGLELDRELFVYDVPIELQDKRYLIHTYRCGETHNEDLVLLHGFAGSSVLYYPMLRELSNKYKVHCLDFIGMGLSSKEKFECKTTEETLDFLVESIEKWREAEGIEKFHLAGHSFGGYISGQYALRYPDRVTKISLMSPIGITKHTEETTVEEIASRLSFFKKQMFLFVINSWKKGVTPHSFIQDNPMIGKYLVGNYMTRLFKLEAEQGEPLKEFMIQMLSLPLGAEGAIHHILKPPRASAVLPLEEKIETMKMPVDCYYGQNDYMDSTGAQRVYERRRKSNFKLKLIPNAAHQLTMQNPIYLSHQLMGKITID